MTCAACSARVERVLSRVDGVGSASVNLALERAEVVPATPVNTAALIKVVEKAGFTARPAAQQAAKRRAEAEVTEVWRRPWWHPGWSPVWTT